MTVEHRQHARCACGSALGEYAHAAARPFVLAGTKRVYERPRPFTIRHIAIDLVLDVPEKAIDGDVTLTVQRIDQKATEIALDAVGFELKSVELLGAKKPAKVEHTYDGETLKVAVPAGADEAKIRVRYRAKPRRGLYFLAPDEHVANRPEQVWTQCQDEDARHVFPCHDKPHVKQTTELKVSVPAKWYALSNGALIDEKVDGDRARFHWKMDEPHSSYLFTLVAGEFTRLDDKAGDVPLTYLVPKGKEEEGRRTFKRTPEMIERFGKLTGVPYPWNKYAQVVVSDFIFGGMENTTATTMYEYILLDERASLDVTSDDLIAHELAHQWFGDYVTCRDWSHGWLNEGFATFMEHVDREGHLGRDEYDYSLKNDMDSYFTEARARYKRPIVCQDYEAPIDIFDRHLYEKGACVLHMLRRRLGDEVFWRGVNHYLTRHARGVVETRDLERALEDVSGQSLERFFEQWVYRPGHPELEVKVSHDDGMLTVSVKQTQPTSTTGGASGGTSDATSPLFELDLAFDIDEDGSIKREVRRVSEAHETFVIPLAKRPRFVIIDPELATLAEVTLEAPADMLREQLRHAKSARSRLLAATALAKKDDPASLKALGRTLEDEKEFWGVRAEAADSLGNLRNDDAFARLAANVGTVHPKVRRRVAHALGRFRTPKAAELLKKLALRDASYLVEAEAARALGATRQSSAFETLLDVLDRPSWADVIRAGAIDGLANLRDERATPHLIARTRYGVPTRGRRAAILALPKLASDRKARETLEDLLEEADPYLRVDVVRAIGDLGDAKARGALAHQLDRDLDGRVRRRIREALRDLGGTGKRELERMREELDSLRGEHAELKSRLTKIEAKGDDGKDKKHARSKR